MSDTPRHPAAWPGRCDIPCCPQCDPPEPGAWQGAGRAGPASERLVAAALDAQGGNPEPGLAASMRLRVYDEGGRMMGALYHRLSDAVEACIGQPGRRTVYRETQDGDLLLLCRVSGRKG